MLSEDGKRIAYLGPPGTYSHQAVLQAFSGKNNTQLPQPTIYDCFVELLNGRSDYAVVPLENVTNGAVMFTLDIFRDLFHKSGAEPPENLSIVGEEFVAINHCLLTEARDLSEIKRVYSHPQAWGQCDVWYRENLRGVEKLDVSSTSKAVETVKGDPTSAAIAGMSAGEVHGVPVLEANISNISTNQTRFLILSSTKREKLYHGDEYNTLISFTVEHHLPGALCKALEQFAKQNVNLTSIASRPRPKGEQPWTYVYFIEVHGHATDSALITALENIQKYCLQVHVLGSFKRNRSDDCN